MDRLLEYVLPIVGGMTLAWIAVSLLYDKGFLAVPVF